MVKEGDVMPATTAGEKLNSCALDRCMARAKEMIGWIGKYPRAWTPAGNGRSGVGAAMAMQGSSISNVDVGSVEIRVNDDGFYT